MGSLANKRVVLGVTGGIAAYKSPDVARRLREAGAEVRVVMTRAACDFITPLTLQAVSGNLVHQHLLDTEAEAAMGHIALARWADCVLVAPASANFMAKLAQGRADDLLSTLCLATSAQVAIAPAMNRQMWDNAATQANLAAIVQRHIKVYGPDAGSQACGETGPGRMSEPAELVERLRGIFDTGALDGLSVLITAGPTWEAIDPVRGLTNRSSGKMGYAVAAAAAEAGGRVTLISGPTHLPDVPRVQTLRVVSARAMHDAVQQHVAGAHIFIGAAAVADYRPAARRDHKLKKDAASITLELERNPDILATVAARRPKLYVVGFAAETENLEANARAKFDAKQLDLVAANLVGEGLGFDTDDNALLLIDAAGREELPRSAKTQLARSLIHAIAIRYHAKSRAENTRQAHRV